MRVIKISGHVLLVLWLTLLTQVGGLAYLINLSLKKYFQSHIPHKAWKFLAKRLSFLMIYSLLSFAIMPVIAKFLGRVPLPITETRHLKPLRLFTILLNRHYVQEDLRQAAFEVAEDMNRQFPGSQLQYLDAGFPFINGFPLLPHRSHDDGKKLDLSFYYVSAESGERVNTSPSFIGYGIAEEPLPGEVNTAETCNEKGYWQYSFLKKLVPQGNKAHFTLDTERTAALVNAFAGKACIGKLFIEPHLKERLKLRSEKIRFHGCAAVRHDDHLHVQLK